MRWLWINGRKSPISVSGRISASGAISTVDAAGKLGQRARLLAFVRHRIAKDLLNSSSPIFVTGMMEMDTSRGEPYLRAEKVTKLG